MYVPPLVPFVLMMLLVGWDALRDGRARSFARAASILRRMGPRPAFDPVTNPRHRDIQAQLQRDNTPGWRAELERIEQELTTKWSLWLLILAEAVLAIVDWLADVQLVHLAGFSAFRTNLIAISVVAAFFVLAEIVVHLAAKRTWGFYAAIAFALGIVALIVVLQLQGVQGDDGATTGDIGLAVLLGLTVIAPAAISAIVLPELRTVARLHAKRSLLRHWVRGDVRRQEQARKQVHTLARWQEWYDRCIGRLEAQYDYKFRRAFLKKGTPEDLKTLLASEPSLVLPVAPTTPVTPSVPVTVDAWPAFPLMNSGNGDHPIDNPYRSTS